MMISVIIATRNRAQLLVSTLDAITAQESPGAGPFEIVVVDNASVDDTPGAVAAVASRTAVPIVYLREEREGKSHALNTALAHARGDLLVLTDDDVLPSPGWLSAYAAALDETRADYAVGRILPLWEVPPPRWLSPALYGVLAVPDGGTRRLHLARAVNEQIMPLGANMALRRHVIDRIGGWDPTLGKLEGTLRTGEDHEFALRMVRAGFAGVYEPGACVHHRVPADRLRLAYFHRWFYDNGVVQAGLDQEYAPTDQYVLRVPRYLWREVMKDALLMVRGTLAADSARAVAGEMRLAWFAGYLRSCWRPRQTSRGARLSAAVKPEP